MQSTIPTIIVNAKNNNLTKHSLRGYLLVLDIQGFTSLSESLLKEGKAGVEKLADTIDSYFNPILSSMIALGGSILHFAGDSVLVFFDQSCDIRQIKIVIQINLNKSQKLKAAFSSGELCWQISEFNGQSAFLFSGDAAEKAYILLAKAKSYELNSEPNALPFFFQSYNLPASQKESSETLQKSIEGEKRYELESAFYKEGLDPRLQESSFRNVIAAFTRYGGNDNEAFMKKMLKISQEHGVYTNYFDKTEKGVIALSIFGYPKMHEDLFAQCASWLMSFKNIDAEILSDNQKEKISANSVSNDEIAIALNYGSAFSGYLGTHLNGTYSCVGRNINLACRIMEKTPYGKILCSENLAKQLELCVDSKNNKRFILSYAESIECKGFSESQKIFSIESSRLVSKRTEKQHFFEREEAFSLLEKAYSLCEQSKNNSAICLFGNDGAGKDSLASSFAEKHPTAKFIHVYRNPLYTSSLEPVTRVLRTVLKLNENQLSKNDFDAAYTRLKNRLATEIIISEERKDFLLRMDNYESFIASLFGFYDEQSAYARSQKDTRLNYLAEACLEILSLYAKENPIIIVFDNLDSFDSDTKAICKRILQDSKSQLFFIVTMQEPNSEIAQIKAKEYLSLLYYEFIKINYLSLEASALLAEEISGKSLSASQKEALFAFSNGRPSYIRQLALLWKESNDNIETNSNEPNAIHNIILSRIEKLGIEFSRALQIASVLGFEFNQRILSTLFLKDSQNKAVHETENKVNINSGSFLKRAIEQQNTFPLNLESFYEKGKTEDLVRSISEFSSAFSHLFIQDAVYKMQMGKRLIALHKLAAQTIEDLFPNDPRFFAERIYHLELAQDLQELKTALLAAITYSEKVCHFSDVLTYSDKLLAISSDFQDRVNVLTSKAQAFAFQGKADFAEEAFSESYKLLSELNVENTKAESSRVAGTKPESTKIENSKVEALKADLLIKWADFYLAQGKLSEAKETLEKLKETKDLSNSLLARYHASWVNYHYYSQNKDPMNEHIELALTHAELSKDDEILGIIYGMQAGLSLSEQKDKEKPFLYLDKQSAVLEKTKNYALEMENLYYRSVLHSRRCEYSTAIDLCEKQIELGSKLGDITGILYAEIRLGNTLTMTEEFEKAIKVHERALRRAENAKNALCIAHAHEGIGDAYYYSGQIDLALPHFEEHYTFCTKTENSIGISIAASNIGRIYADKGDTKKAYAYFKEELKKASDKKDELSKALAYGYIGMLALQEFKLETAENCLEYAIKGCEGFDVPCRLSRLYLEKARLLYVRDLIKQKNTDRSYANEIIALSDKAKTEAKKVTEPIVIDIAFKAEILKARILSIFKENSLKDFLSKQNEEKLLGMDKCVYYYEQGRLGEKVKNWNKAREVNKYLFEQMKNFDAKLFAFDLQK